MKVQLITNTPYKGNVTRISPYSNIDTLDSYDFNVVDLSCQDVWKQNSPTMGGSNYLNDLLAIFGNIKLSSKSLNIIVLPKNLYFRYYYSSISNNYTKKALLRDNKSLITSILYKLVPPTFVLEYMPNKTTIANKIVESDFFFNDIPNGSKYILKSIDSEKIVSCCYENIMLTCLNIVDGNCVQEYINTFFASNSAKIPDWINTISFNKDEEIIKAIEDKNSSIERIQEEISVLQEKQKKNLYFKSILFLNDKELVERIYKILYLLFGVDLSAFEDQMLDDFNYELDGVTYVGEIKGITSNLKNMHLSELENNKQIFLEKQDKIDDAKGLLIVNHQRNTELSKRIPIDQKQINYAKRYGLLIVETITLLEVLDAHFNGTLNVDKLKELLKSHVGILKDEWK